MSGVKEMTREQHENTRNEGSRQGNKREKVELHILTPPHLKYILMGHLPFSGWELLFNQWARPPGEVVEPTLTAAH